MKAGTSSPQHPVLLPLSDAAPTSLPGGRRDSLISWLNLYVGIEAEASSENTYRAKKRDLEAFLGYFMTTTGTSDHPDQWTRPVTAGFVKHLHQNQGRSATTVNRALATLRHCSAWVHSKRPFLAGNPCDRIQDLDVDDPVWKGLSEIEVTRLRSAGEQLLHLKTRKNQRPLRDQAVFLVLLHTGLRVTELLSLDLAQYEDRHFHNVKRKGRKVSRKVFLPKDAKVALDDYFDGERGRSPGPLFQSRSGVRLSRQNVDDLLKTQANQANAQLPAKDRIRLSAHVLRHTLLRKAAEKYGVQYAMELAGHSSTQYIWRYVRPSDEQKEAAQEELF